ncbi:MAG: T9SS type A sorting domain-containing protein, partial [Flavobacteriales bacterium]|nr:T9SS type A sorting domain-containing protein [Flavobacteriales bacterium]
SFDGAESVPFECGVDDGFGGYNRSYNTSTSDATLPLVCFSACSECIIDFVDENEASFDFQLFPNPTVSNDQIQIVSDTPISNAVLTDLNGRIMGHSDSENRIQLNADLQAGVYLITVEMQGILVTKRLLVH